MARLGPVRAISHTPSRIRTVAFRFAVCPSTFQREGTALDCPADNWRLTIAPRCQTFVDSWQKLHQRFPNFLAHPMQVRQQRLFPLNRGAIKPTASADKPQRQKRVEGGKVTTTSSNWRQKSAAEGAFRQTLGGSLTDRAMRFDRGRHNPLRKRRKLHLPICARLLGKCVQYWRHRGGHLADLGRNELVIQMSN